MEFRTSTDRIHRTSSLRSVVESERCTDIVGCGGEAHAHGVLRESRMLLYHALLEYRVYAWIH